MEVLWSRSLHMRPSSSTLAATAEAVVVAERRSRLVRLDLRTGEPLWEQRVEDCYGSTVLTADTCLHLSQTGVLHCFDLSSGNRLWSTPQPWDRRDLSVSGTTILVGGWRGYHPLTRLSRAGGEPLPTALGKSFRQLAPLHDLTGRPVLLADPKLPRLWQLDPESGALVADWPLPAPVSVPDGGPAGALTEGGLITFQAGSRIVMAFQPDTGVRELWRHDRDLRHVSTFDGTTLWLLDDAGCTLVDLRDGTRSNVELRASSVPSSVAAGPHGATIAFRDGDIVAVDRDGVALARLRLPIRAGELRRVADGTVLALGKGYLMALAPVLRRDARDARR
ncbi:PQQ-like beta-propeller repeat protein [Actinoplanes bogorensis]|uniref:PQQ-like beta-propeller repeat protein n=1 Tax=Paractinoplanes bogorensis TaxID=1610840 RepID=A0ABS5YNK2_9ACTN|nr:PQQ-binding-like beta-propeller repeat protein [Actinoplanes bogorensis]MBU2665039.1 PQQ-like beta-propeller repeat protein [Actinoplanes bogorensis]